MSETQTQQLTGGESIMGFVAFLTSLPTPVVASSGHTVYDMMELGQAFLDSNQLRETIHEDFHKRLKFPEDPRPQLAREQEERVQVAEARNQDIEELSAVLVRKLDKVFSSPEYKSVFFCAQNHHQPYQGETVSEELDALRDKLGIEKPAS